MSELFDNISRIVASRIPRRKALSMIGSALGGAALFGLNLRETGGRSYTCSPGTCPAGSQCCTISGTVYFGTCITLKGTTGCCITRNGICGVMDQTMCVLCYSGTFGGGGTVCKDGKCVTGGPGGGVSPVR